MENRFYTRARGFLMLVALFTHSVGVAAPIVVMSWNIMGEITANQFPVYDPSNKLNLKHSVRIQSPYVKWPQLRFDNRALPIIWTINKQTPDVIGLTEMMRCDDPKNDDASGTGNIPYIVYLLRSNGYEVFPTFPKVVIEAGELYFEDKGKLSLNIPKNKDILPFTRRSTDGQMLGSEPQNICSPFSPTPFIAYKKNRFQIIDFPEVQPITPKIKKSANEQTYWMSSTTAVLKENSTNRTFKVSVIHTDPSL